MHTEARAEAEDLITALCERSGQVHAAVCSVLPWSEDGPPEWIQILPLGPDIIGRDGRSWRLEDPEALVAKFAADGIAIPLDWEHATELRAPKGERADAAGFIQELSVARDGGAGRTPGVWGRVEWSPDGATSVRSRAYRYVSPAFAHTPTGVIVCLLSVGLTNRPNLDLFALNHQGAGIKENPVNEQQLNALRQRLGLAADVPADQVLTALNARLDAAPLSNVGMVPKTDLEAALNRANVAEAELAKTRKVEHDRAVEAFIEKGKAEGKFTPASVDFYRSLCSTAEGLANIQKGYETLPVIVAPGSQIENAPAPKVGSVDVLTADEKARCARLGVSEEVALNTKREDAFRGH